VLRREGDFFVRAMRTQTLFPSRILLACECVCLFVVLPIVIGLYPTRWIVAPCVWTAAAYAAFVLQRTPGFSWYEEWRGLSLSWPDLRHIVLRFLVSTAGIVLLTFVVQPARLFMVPTQKTGMWLVVVLVYPLLSALPQELLFRSFFFRRYAPLFTSQWLWAASAGLFGFSHVMFRNPISPILSIICGFFLASSYKRHASLRQAALEHALYGDMVFTVGLGIYFVLST
jgi:hypothetical protein